MKKEDDIYTSANKNDLSKQIDESVDGDSNDDREENDMDLFNLTNDQIEVFSEIYECLVCLGYIHGL